GWASRPHGLFDEISGITNNPVESINAVVKKWVAWKELTSDKLVLFMYLLMGYYCNELKRGFCDVGNYHLKVTSKQHKTDRSLLSLVNAYNPNEILEKAKQLMEAPSSALTDLLSPIPSPPLLDLVHVENSNQPHDQFSSSDKTENEPRSASSTSMITAPPVDAQAVVRRTLTPRTKAALLVDQNCVKFDQDDRFFTVTSLDQQSIYVVHMRDPNRLFKCSCPSTLQLCSHIIAVKVYLKMPVNDNDYTLNAGADRKMATKENKDGLSGRKRPRRVDKQANKVYEQRLLAQPSTSTITPPQTRATRNTLQPFCNIANIQLTTTQSSINSSPAILSQQQTATASPSQPFSSFLPALRVISIQNNPQSSLNLSQQFCLVKPK
ncbi:unnamed protein product, partial [Didymodactylos carnosus]